MRRPNVVSLLDPIHRLKRCINFFFLFCQSEIALSDLRLYDLSAPKHRQALPLLLVFPRRPHGRLSGGQCVQRKSVTVLLLPRQRLGFFIRPPKPRRSLGDWNHRADNTDGATDEASDLISMLSLGRYILLVSVLGLASAFSVGAMIVPADDGREWFAADDGLESLLESREASSEMPLKKSGCEPESGVSGLVVIELFGKGPRKGLIRCGIGGGAVSVSRPGLVGGDSGLNRVGIGGGGPVLDSGRCTIVDAMLDASSSGASPLRRTGCASPARKPRSHFLGFIVTGASGALVVSDPGGWMTMLSAE